MALPGMNFDFGSRLNESARRQIMAEAEQQAADAAATGSNVEGEGGGRWDECIASGMTLEECRAAESGSPRGILRDPLVQKGLALIVAAFVGGGIAYLVFGRRG